MTLDSSRGSENILSVLQREAVERRQNRGNTRSLSLGACIRRLVVCHKGYWKALTDTRPRKPGRSIEDTSEDAYDNDEDKVQQWRLVTDQLNRRLADFYNPTVRFVISSLVHLESLQLSQIDWTQDTLHSLAASTIRHLLLCEVQMTDIVPIMDSSVVLPLETLDIRLGWEFKFSYGPHMLKLDASNSWNTILRLCSASLKTLRLSHHPSMKTSENLVSFPLQFPQLRQLDITWETTLDESALRSLILTSTQLSTLAINYGHRVTRELMDREGEVQSLETLILNYFEDLPSDSTLDILKRNPQLNAVAFDGDGAPNVVLERALTLLSRFSQFRKLSMIWNGTFIPVSSLTALSSLSLLEDLHLSSGFQHGWRHDWAIRHHNISLQLKPFLRRLRRIAFTRDGYSYPRFGRLFQYENYYELRRADWDSHKKHMRVMALLYTNAFPTLEFIHVGEISFKVSRVGNSPVLEESDDPDFSWRTMFGMSI